MFFQIAKFIKYATYENIINEFELKMKNKFLTDKNFAVLKLQKLFFNNIYKYLNFDCSDDKIQFKMA